MPAHRTVNSPGNDGWYFLVLGFFHWSGQLRWKVTTFLQFRCKRERERERERERDREREKQQREIERERESE